MERLMIKGMVSIVQLPRSRKQRDFRKKKRQAPGLPSEETGMRNYLEVFALTRALRRAL